MKSINPMHTDLFQQANDMGFGDIHFKSDADSGLNAIIAIHDTTLGPALGGCRFLPYDSTQSALLDAMNLAQGMSFKAAIAGLPLGGGKSVIIKPEKSFDRKKLFLAFGHFIEELNGRYITSVDSGTNVSDMDVISTNTSHVASTSKQAIATGDPSPYTALGVRRAIEAAVKIKYEKNNLSNIHVAIQGLGHVGYFLAKELHELGAQLSFCDINSDNVTRIKKMFGGQAYSPNEIFDVECDVFAPCALGGAINATTIKRLNTGVIVGAANNQLATLEMGRYLHEKNILYAPDYVVNAGGLIQVFLKDKENSLAKVDNIYDTLINIFKTAKNNQQPPVETADALAKKLILDAETKHAA